MEQQITFTLGGFVAAILAVVGVGRALGFNKMRKDVRAFLMDWNGEPARDGFEGRESFPTRMTKVEKRTQELARNGGSSVADKVHDIARDIDEIKKSAESNGAAIARVDTRIAGVEERVTDHRRRNDEAVRLLRESLEHKLADLMEGQVDSARLEAYRATLVEIGMVDRAAEGKH